MAVDWTPLQRIIADNQRFVLSSHVRPDADAVGSELALSELLEAQGKSVRIINPSALPANLLFLDPERRILTVGEGGVVEQACETDVHIILDTSAWAQLGKIGTVLKKTSAVKVVIDHHAVADDLGALSFQDKTAEATGAMIFRAAETLGWPITDSMANFLFCAIATDTGWFRFPSVTGDTLRICGRLIDLGAKPARLYQALYEQSSLARVKLAGRVLSRITVECDGRLAYICVHREDFAETGAVPADTEDLVNECLRIAGTEAAFILVETPNRDVKVSLRSRNALNVAALAKRFGGGGHKQAAGAVMSGPLDDVLANVLKAMKAELKCQS
ncbi:MAG TPA: bifunctional oligoribonuclease/PAP phosphatase NrnA [Planctomycetaceae bacterium]|nr:bifunctional oligoribonuclease/PAP phosphatase NrnA [Planctomycetaceae bacterium]